MYPVYMRYVHTRCLPLVTIKVTLGNSRTPITIEHASTAYGFTLLPCRNHKNWAKSRFCGFAGLIHTGIWPTGPGPLVIIFMVE